MESSRVWAAGLVMRDCTHVSIKLPCYSIFTGLVKKEWVVAISGIDTRELTLRLRELGATSACISTEVKHPEHALAQCSCF